MVPLVERTIRYGIENGPTQIYSSPLCADTLELMMATLRTTRGWVQFGFHGRTRARQQLLFSLRGAERPRRQRLPRRAMHGAALARGVLWLVGVEPAEAVAA